MAETLLTVRELRAERDYRVLFDGLSFSLNAGQVALVTGANGSGKTTLLRRLAGLAGDTAGIFYRGAALADDPVRFRADTVYLAHNPGITGALTPIENLQWWLSCRGRAATEAELCEALAAAGLSGFEHQACASLSAGQMRRVALTRLLVTPASLWILDEPLTAVDKTGVAWLEQRLLQHCQQGGAIVMTTHQPLQSLREDLRVDLETHR